MTAFSSWTQFLDPVCIQVPWPPQGRDSGLWDRCRLFIFFYKVTAHDYLYWALWAATESTPLRGEGGVKVDMLSLALQWNKKEDQLIKTKGGGGGWQSWLGTPTLPIKKSDSHEDEATPKHTKLTWKRICLQIIPSCGLFKSANHILEHTHAHTRARHLTPFCPP